jgi:hypothetical protein
MHFMVVSHRRMAGLQVRLAQPVSTRCAVQDYLLHLCSAVKSAAGEGHGRARLRCNADWVNEAFYEDINAEVPSLCMEMRADVSQ